MAAQLTCRSMVGRRAWDLSPMVIQGGAGAGVQQRMVGRASLVRISEMAMDPRGRAGGGRKRGREEVLGWASTVGGTPEPDGRWPEMGGGRRWAGGLVGRIREATREVGDGGWGMGVFFFV